MVESKQVEFVSNQRPVLVDGKYRLALQHQLSYGDTQSFGKVHHFQVQGERFSLKPDEILKVFPPRNVLGKFDDTLPHVVISRRTLPWERLPQKPGTATDSDPPQSWLAILVFTAGDAPALVTGTLADLFPGDGGTLPSDHFSYGSDWSTMDDFLEVGEAASDACTYIDLSAPQFAACAPSHADLQWNAHVRSNSSTSDAFKTFYSIVVANALPWPGTGAVAHLVSLEGLADQLPQDDGSFATPPAWSAIRLVSLTSWQFRVAPLEASFEHMLLGLNRGVTADGGANTNIGDSQLRLPAGMRPAAAPAGAPAAPFDSGYSVLGGAGPAPPAAAWYRGPLLPSTVAPPTADDGWAGPLLPATSGAALAAAVGTTPAQDLSYAAAWQVGRLLALADKDFALGQVTWKRDARLALNALLGQANRLGSGSRAAYAALVRAVLADPAKIAGLLGATLSVGGTAGTLAIPQKLVDWLAALAQLKLLPFHYLVPDSSMFPPESLRFSQLDPRWLACLLDGAWSLDRQPRARWAFDTLYQPWRQLRDGSLAPSSGGSAWPVSGALLSSQVIPGYWPGIEFETAPAATMLREDLLGSSQLILLFDTALTALTLKQPAEGVHFGFEIDADDNLSKRLRYLEVGGTFYPTPPAGSQVVAGEEAPDQNTLTNVPQRSRTVIQLDALAKAIGAQIGLPPSPGIEPVDFAVELVESMASVTFSLPIAGGS